MPKVSNALTREELKQALKEALAETLEERRELLHDVVLEVLEDIALVRAIEEGRKSKPVSRAQVLKTLRGKS